MKILKAEEAAYIDQQASIAFGLDLSLLMENAGRGVAEAILECYAQDKLDTLKPLFIVGVGNNGADGLVAARHLTEQNIASTIWIVGKLEKATELFKKQYQVLKRIQEAHVSELNFPVLSIKFIEGANLGSDTKIMDDYRSELENYNLIVEGIIGIGLKGVLRNSTILMLNLITDWRNKSNNHRLIAIDVPAGVITNTGNTSDSVPYFDYTVTLGAPKQGLYLYPGASHCGKIIVKELGLPWQQLLSNQVGTFLVTSELAASILPKRRATAHKGSNGHAFIIGGSNGMFGAPVLASLGALKSGAGKVTVSVPNDCLAQIQQLIPLEVMSSSFQVDETVEKTLEALDVLCQNKDAIAIGPGLGRTEVAGRWVKQFILNVVRPLVIDADGLYALGEAEESQAFLGRLENTVILTPHVGEFMRLSGLNSKEIESNRIEIAREFAQKCHCILVLKGAPTVVATPEGKAFVNSTGNAGMGTGGMGDVLTGIITALLAQGVEPSKAAILGVYLHGAAADVLARTQDWGYTPSEVARQIGIVAKL